MSTVKRNETHINSSSVLFTCLCLCVHMSVYVLSVSPWRGKKKVIVLTIKHPVFSIRSHLLHISAFKLLLNHRIWQASLEGI